MEVGPGGRRGKELEVKSERLHEIVGDVLYHLLLGCGRKARNRYGLSPLFLLICPDEFSDEEVVDPEILPPRREAVRLVDDEPHDIPCKEDSLDGVRP